MRAKTTSLILALYISISCLGVEILFAQGIRSCESNRSNKLLLNNIHFEQTDPNHTIFGSKKIFHRLNISFKEISLFSQLDLNEIYSLQRGIKLQDNSIYIRNGRQDEVGYYLDDLPITDLFRGGAALNIPLYALEEIDIYTGGYSTEYGGANSGLIFHRMKTGSKELSSKVYYSTDNITAKSSASFFNGKKGIGSYTYGFNQFGMTVSGPLLSERIKYFAIFDYDFQRDKTPQPYTGIDFGIFEGEVGTSKNLLFDFEYPAGPAKGNSFQQYTYAGNISFQTDNIYLKLCGLFQDRESFNPFNSSFFGGNITNFLNTGRTELNTNKSGYSSIRVDFYPAKFISYSLSAGYSYRFEKVFDPLLKDNFLGYGDSLANAEVGVTNFSSRYQQPYRINVFDFRFLQYGSIVSDYGKQKDVQFTIKSSIKYEGIKNHSLKLGVGYNTNIFRRYYLYNATTTTLAAILAANMSTPPTYPPEIIIQQRGVDNYGYDVWGNEIDDKSALGPRKPIFVNLFFEDEFRSDIYEISAGIRYEYFDLNNYVVRVKELRSLYNPITSNFEYNLLEKSETYSTLSPRLALNYKFSAATKVYFNYGLFTQIPKLADIYDGIYHSLFLTRSDPVISEIKLVDIKPVKTSLIEAGISHSINEYLTLEVSAYYKKTWDHISFGGYDNISFFAPVYKNDGEGLNQGAELSVNLKRYNGFEASMNLELADAEGNFAVYTSSDGLRNFPVYPGAKYSTPSTPLPFNSKFKGSIILDYLFEPAKLSSALSGLNISALLTFNSGHPYTKFNYTDMYYPDALPAGGINEETTPWVYRLDLRIGKTFSLGDVISAELFLYVINLFDIKIENNVFMSTGRTDEDDYLSKYNVIEDPLFRKMYRAINIDYSEEYQKELGLRLFGPPRQIFFGVKVNY